uniref:Uncharacterized protein n=1 Tax=Anopheles farauti TaxID=69004 RepID=A0A182QHE9_9DIPT
MSGVGVLGTGETFGTLVIGSLLIVDTDVDSCSRVCRFWYMVGTAVGDSADVWKKTQVGPTNPAVGREEKKTKRRKHGDWLEDRADVLPLTSVSVPSTGLTVFSQPSRVFLFRRQDLRYVRIRFRARSANSGNWRVHESMIAWIFSFGCFEIGMIRSRFSSTNRRTNMLNAFRRSGSFTVASSRSSESSSDRSSSSFCSDEFVSSCCCSIGDDCRSLTGSWLKFDLPVIASAFWYCCHRRSGKL